MHIVCAPVSLPTSLRETPPAPPELSTLVGPHVDGLVGIFHRSEATLQQTERVHLLRQAGANTPSPLPSLSLREAVHYTNRSPSIRSSGLQGVGSRSRSGSAGCARSGSRFAHPQFNAPNWQSIQCPVSGTLYLRPDRTPPQKPLAHPCPSTFCHAYSQRFHVDYPPLPPFPYLSTNTGPQSCLPQLPPLFPATSHICLALYRVIIATWSLFRHTHLSHLPGDVGNMDPSSALPPSSPCQLSRLPGLL